MNPVEQLKTYIPKFLTQKKTIILFFSLVLFFCAFFVVVYRPLGLLKPPAALTSLDYRLYSLILVLIGLVVFSISRWLLYLVQRRADMKLSSYFIWVGIEFFVLVVSLTAVAWWLNEDASVPLFTLVGRVLVSVVALLSVPYIITFLVFLLQQKRLEIASLTTRLTESTVDKSAEAREEVLQFYDKGGRLVFVTKRSNILYIEAADNYTVIHYISGDKEDSLVLHNSLRNIAETFASQGMVRCHRGYLVNLANVKYLRKEKDGLVLEIAYCDRLIPVSKTYAQDVVQQFAN
ncbi:MAG: LytTR family transcriptional regulator [Bacteroidales bacterium]|nr:LytTR family transcriptional regulator [Bacteroidales bacterium]